VIRLSKPVSHFHSETGFGFTARVDRVKLHFRGNGRLRKQTHGCLNYREITETARDRLSHRPTLDDRATLKRGVIRLRLVMAT